MALRFVSTGPPKNRHEIGSQQTATRNDQNVNFGLEQECRGISVSPFPLALFGFPLTILAIMTTKNEKDSGDQEIKQASLPVPMVPAAPAAIADKNPNEQEAVKQKELDRESFESKWDELEVGRKLETTIPSSLRNPDLVVPKTKDHHHHHQLNASTQQRVRRSLASLAKRERH